MNKLLLIISALTLSALTTSSSYAEPNSGLVSCWKLDEDSGTTASDSIGINDGAVTGASWDTGISGNALSFDGDYDRVFVNHDESLNPDVMSFELWVNPNESSIQSVLLFKYSLSKGFFVREIAGKWAFHLNGWLVYSTSDVEVGNWNHLAGTYDGTSLKIYVNGVNEATEVPWRPLVLDNNLNMIIGSSGGAYYNGFMDEIAFHDKALSDAEINQHYQNGLHALGCGVVNVAIDINPSSVTNSISLKSKGLINVAILSTNIADGDSLDLDATQVDPATIKFGPAQVAIAHSNAHAVDVDSDGDIDLLVHFRISDTGIACGDTDATLSGTTFDGLLIGGTDIITTTGCN